MNKTKYVISKQFTFSASHQLSGLPDSHQCARLHGHNYTVEVVLGSNQLNTVGFIVDYGELIFVKEYLDNNFDHRHLNDVVAFNPTAESLAKHIYDFCSLYLRENNYDCKMIEVIVSETEKTSATYHAT